MKGPISDKIETTLKNWWVSLVLGIIFIIGAFSVMLTPFASYMAISLMFSVCMFLSGIFTIFFALSNSKIIRGWGWYLALGVVDLAAGIYLMWHPAISALVIPIVVAIWLMFRGLTTIGYAVVLKRHEVRNWGWYVFFGILAVICSLIVMWQPAIGGFAVIYIVAFALLFFGVFRVMLSLDLRRMNKRYKERFGEKE